MYAFVMLLSTCPNSGKYYLSRSALIDFKATVVLSMTFSDASTAQSPSRGSCELGSTRDLGFHCPISIAVTESLLRFYFSHSFSHVSLQLVSILNLYNSNYFLLYDYVYVNSVCHHRLNFYDSVSLLFMIFQHYITLTCFTVISWFK